MDLSAPGMALRLAGVSMVPGRMTFAVMPSVLIFERDGADQRYQRRLRCAVGADAGAGILGGAAADGDDASCSRFAHVWDHRSQHVERAVEIHVEHALERGVVCVGDGLASGEAADQVRENVDLSEAGDNRVGCLLRGGETVERRGECGEVRVLEVGLLDFRRESNNGETGVQQGFGDVRSEAAVGSGDEGSFSGIALPHDGNGHQITQ